MKANWNKYDETGANPTTACESGSYYYFYDALGNVNGVLEEHGSATPAPARYYRWEMDAFGNDLPGGNNFLAMDQPGPKEHLTGKMFDTVSGLYYFHARWYDAEVGRFVGRDPSKQDFNFYILALSSPSVYVDPSGLKSCIKLAQGPVRLFGFLPVGAKHCVYIEENDDGTWDSVELAARNFPFPWATGYVYPLKGLFSWYRKDYTTTDITNYCRENCLKNGADRAFTQWMSRGRWVEEEGGGGYWAPFGKFYKMSTHNSNHYMQDLLDYCCDRISVTTMGEIEYE